MTNIVSKTTVQQFSNELLQTDFSKDIWPLIRMQRGYLTCTQAGSITPHTNS